MFSFEEDSFINGCEKAVERYKSNNLNQKGLKLQDEFKVSNTVDKMLELINKI
jgi:hypothetical protein